MKERGVVDVSNAFLLLSSSFFFFLRREKQGTASSLIRDTEEGSGTFDFRFNFPLAATRRHCFPTRRPGNAAVLPIELSLLIDSVDRPMINNRSVDLSEEYYLGGMLESIEISLINILFRSYY